MHLPLQLRRCGAWVLAAAFAAPAACIAQSAASYPTQPIRMIVPFAVGGPNDVMARVLGHQLSQETGQPVVIDNKAGAGGVIGTDAVAKSKPDGYTIGFVSGPFAMVPALQAKLPYDTVNDFAPVSKVAESPMLMMVPSDSRFKTAGELIAFARKNPGKLTYGSGGAGSTPHLTTELLGDITGAKFMHVPYKGGGESIRALMGGEIDMLIDSITSTATPLASGRVKPLAIGQATRSVRLPNVPTFEEAGIKNFAVTHWVGVVAPAKTPAAVIAALNAQIVKALRAPDVAQKLAELGATPAASSPEDFRKFVADELKKWQAVVKNSNIQKQ